MESQKHRLEGEYLKNSVPAIGLAVVTVLLSTYSYSFVQPRISEHYQSICERNLRELGFSGLEDEEISGISNTNTSELSNLMAPNRITKPPEMSIEARYKLLIESKLCLRRLAILFPEDDSVRYQSAMISELLADWYREQAWALAGQSDKTAEIAGILASERNELNQAVDLMLAVKRLKGPNYLNGTGWLAENSFLDAIINKSDLAPLEASSREFVALAIKETSGATPKAVLKSFNRNAKNQSYAILGKVLTARGLSLGLAADDEKLRVLAEASEAFDIADSKDLVTQSWQALAKSPIDQGLAKDWAWGAAQDFWSLKTVERPRSEELDAVLRCLLVGGDFEEAQSFAFNQLKKLPAFEQSRFRELAAATCMRQLVVNQLISSATNAEDILVSSEKHIKGKGPSKDFAILDLAVRLQPEVPGLPEALIAMGSMKPSDSALSQSSLIQFIQRAIDSSGRDGLLGIVDAIMNAKSGNSNEVVKAIERVTQDDPAYAVLATKVAMILVSAHSSEGASQGKSPESITHQSAVDWLKAINEHSPDILSAWFARGSLHLTAKEFDEAIECLEFLAKRVPGSEQVQEMLETARAR